MASQNSQRKLHNSRRNKRNNRFQVAQDEPQVSVRGLLEPRSTSSGKLPSFEEKPQSSRNFTHHWKFKKCNGHPGYWKVQLAEFGELLPQFCYCNSFRPMVLYNRCDLWAHYKCIRHCKGSESSN